MLFKVIVCADDGDEVDYSIDLLRSDDAQSFIRGWQALQDAAQQSVHPTNGGCSICGSPKWAHGVIGHDFTTSTAISG